MGAGDMRAARDKFIEAIVADPYKRAPWAGASQWAQRNNLKLSQPDIQSPNSFKVEQSGNANITIDPKSLDKKDGSGAWLMYEMSRVLWRNKKFAETFPKEKTYRHSLAEESDALTGVALSAGEQQQGGTAKTLDPALQTLIKLKNSGLLEAYVLLSRPDQGIAQDYQEYRQQHRDKLRQYLSEYVVPQPQQ